MDIAYHFDSKDLKLRKFWRIWFFITISLSLVLGVVGVIDFWSGVEDKGQAPFALLGGLIVLIIQSAIYYALYRCGYKKEGTKFLTVYLVLTFVTLLLELFSEIKDFSTTSPEYAGYIFFLPYMAFSIWGYILTIQVRKMNKKIQEFNKLAPTLGTAQQ